MSSRETIIEHIQGLSEKQAKEKLARLLLNYDRVGYGDYTVEKCMNDYKETYEQIILNDLFRR